MASVCRREGTLYGVPVTRKSADFPENIVRETFLKKTLGGPTCCG
jgi:hypothetical protein